MWIHRVDLKIALLVAGAVGAAGFIFVLIGGMSPVYPVLTSVVAGVAAFFVVKRLVSDRLRRVDAAVAELRKLGGRSEPISDGVDDEIERLIRKSDQANHAVRKRVTELSRAEHYRREYVGDVSHEIKTPVFAIQGFAETLLEGALEDPAVNRGFVERILNQAIRLNSLTSGLAEISRLEAGTPEIVRGRVSVRDLYEDVRESLEIGARSRNVELVIDISSGAEFVDGDRERIRQVVTNLVDNAIKYNRAGGWVRLSSERDHDLVRLSVSDSGIGLSPEDISRVTERFYRVDRSRSREEGGTGLGLSIVKHILAAHRTKLEIVSTPGEGSSFSFSLPTAPVP